jgi:3-hydroxyacyl-[acyl-carrier-protein] dehydratase
MKLPLSSVEIMEILPHRPPFLLVDIVTELEEGKRCVGLKCVSMGEPHFVGHFPNQPVMPGVLIVEALAQVGAIAILSMEENKGKIPFFAGIDSFRFRKMVVPGDTLKLEVEIDKMRGPIGKGSARALVGGEIAADGTLTFALR